MEPQLKEIVNTVIELTETKSLDWKAMPSNINVLYVNLDNVQIRITNSGANIAFNVYEDDKSVAGFAEARTVSSKLVTLFAKAKRQMLGTDEKLDNALSKLKKLKK